MLLAQRQPVSSVVGSVLRVGLLFLLGMLTACGSTSKLRTDSADARKQIRDYERVVVADFEATATKETDDQQKQAKFLVQLNDARSGFADLIAEELVDRKAFTEVSREPLEGKALRISGTITRFEKGNVAARVVTGFVGQAHFEAEVTVADIESGEVLGTFDVDRNSWPLPIGASSNAVQNVGMFMSGAANRIADEMAVARGVLKRGETGGDSK